MEKPYLYTAMWLMVLQLGSYSFAHADEGAFANELGLNPTEAVDARKAIVVWLECEECNEGELQAVLKLGQLAVPTLANVLKEGPSPVKREVYRYRLLDNYKTMQTFLRVRPNLGPVNISSEAYLALNIENYVTLFKVRAATALGKIGGINARNALKEALVGEKNHTVTKTVKEALANM